MYTKLKKLRKVSSCACKMMHAESVSSDSVKRYASTDAEMVGIASAERFVKAPEGRRPQDVLPGARSVIVLGMALPRFIVKTAPSVQFVDYLRTVEARMRILGQKVSSFLERHGFDTFP